MEEGGLTFGSVDDSLSRESGGATNDSLGDQTANRNGYTGELYNPEDESSSKGPFEWSAAANPGAEDSRQSNGDASMEQSQESFRKRSHSSSSSRNAEDSESVAVKRLKTVVENMELPNEDDEEEDVKIWSALDPVRPDLSLSKLADLEKFWKPVMESPKDFQAWTSLLQYVDHESDVAAAREAYDLFLRRYPYCYGYWKKWADYEKKKATRKDCEKVFEMGIAAVPLSVDLWLHYLNYCRAQDTDQVEFIREQFERAVAACGLEFRSDRLWEMYINWEVERDDLKRVFQIYDRLLAIPTQFHATHWEK